MTLSRTSPDPQQNVRDCECWRNVIIFESKPVRAEKIISKSMIQPLHRGEIDGGRWKKELRKSGRGDSARARQPCLFTDALLLSKADFSINMVTQGRPGVLRQCYKTDCSKFSMNCIWSCCKITINTLILMPTFCINAQCSLATTNSLKLAQLTILLSKRFFVHFRFLSIIITDLFVSSCYA